MLHKDDDFLNRLARPQPVYTLITINSISKINIPRPNEI